jgi:hypothetical protein
MSYRYREDATNPGTFWLPIVYVCYDVLKPFLRKYTDSKSVFWNSVIWRDNKYK